MASTVKPTIFFVHGAWHQPAHYAPIMAKLEADGFPCFCPQQPSFGVLAGGMKTQKMYYDAKHIRDLLQKFVEEDQLEIVVVLHSYGGVVGTQAVDGSLSVKQRSIQGKQGGVRALVYMCAFILPPNASLGDAFGGNLPPFITTESDGSCNMIDPRMRFYSELDEQAAQHWLTLTKPHPAIAQLTPITYTAYFHHPISYIVCTKDKALLPDVQRFMIKQCRESGLEVDEYEIAADHSPYLSNIPETVVVIERIAERSTG